MLAQHLRETLSAAWPPSQWQDVGVVVACSGGADSVALLRLLADIASREGGQGELVVAHYHHGLRGKDADEDAAFVETLAAGLGLPLQSGRFGRGTATSGTGSFFGRSTRTTGRSLPEKCACPLPALEPHTNEAAARSARYAFLLDVAHRRGCRYVVTGHTADDQAETILHNLLRGGGLAGLAGMTMFRPFEEPAGIPAAVTLARPLLGVRRSQIEAYLAEIDQPFRTDATNASDIYTRNRIRRDALPQMAAALGRDVVPAILRAGEHAADAQTEIERHAAELAARAIALEPTGGQFTVSRPALADATQFLIAETLRHAWRAMGWPEQAMTKEHWDQLAAACLSGDQTSGETAPAASFTLPGDIQVTAQGEDVHARRQPAAEAAG